MIIDERFNGPPGSANGGYAAGLIARHVDADAVEVRLAAPPPLGVELTLSRSDETVELRDGERLIALGRPAELDLDVPAPVTPAEAAAAGARTPVRAEEHPFPTCFGCGPLRQPGEALRHMCGPVEGRPGLVACTATTVGELPVQEGALATEVVWAALDCPSSMAVLPWGTTTNPHVLGTLTARLERPVRAGEPHVCIAWALGSDGRKKYGASAVLDAQGRVCARAKATWIELRSGP